MTRRLLASAVALAAAACGPGMTRNPPPLDRFYFPIGVATATVPTTSGPALLVSSTNFDLLYDATSGGTVISVDPARATGPGLLPPGSVLGTVLVPSFGGPLAVADKDACGLGDASRVLVASRFTDQVYRIAIDSAGGLSCGDGCAIASNPARTNPYGVTVACRRTADGTTVVRHDAFVTYLRPAGGVPELTQIDLTSPDGSPRTIALDASQTNRHSYAAAYDALADRLWVTGQIAGDAPMWAVDLATPCDPSAAGCPVVHLFDLYGNLRGAEPRGIALSTPGIVDPATSQPFPQRVYVAARVYDPDLATSIGGRPAFDVAAKLLVLDVDEGVAGAPTLRLAQIVDLPIGADEVKVLSVRPGKRDLLAISCVEEGTVVLYDDDMGAVVKVFGPSQGANDPSHMPEAAPQTGRQPVGLAVVPSGTPGLDLVYVTAFLSDIVQVIEVDLQDPAGPNTTFVETIGEIRKP